ncbi:hypothetical protein B9Z55_018558 [Caenorhabditis nigoni]|uniref:Uncharacterized protein n=1 Tax=Caenorhabditis nigoni TaxID=1611254 RepID=A0A2G5TEY1_9PELO|nr:hypothetical protein B9Z55_018558 [Caenorhabditis nigoni]
METWNGTSYQAFIFSQTVILVQSFFEYDSGFYGNHCTDRTTSISTTMSTTTPESTTTSGITKVVKVDTENAPGRSMTFFCVSLMIVIVILLALICTICILFRSSHHTIFIQPQTPTSIKTKCKITIEDSACYSPMV